MDSHVAETPISDAIRAAAHEVQPPVFFPILIIIVAYLPIFTLQRVEGRLFRPMAWTVAFALLGALFFALLLAPVLASYFFRRGFREWHNPVLTIIQDRYCRGLAWCIRHPRHTAAAALTLVACGAYLAFGGVIGSEFLPHLDEGAIWVRGTLAPSTGPSEGERVVRQGRLILAAFPEVPRW
jgi:cobalt-zinc-cadmium resistance protein CzcA